jgi:hypothetical protein
LLFGLHVAAAVLALGPIGLRLFRLNLASLDNGTGYARTDQVNSDPITQDGALSVLGQFNLHCFLAQKRRAT